MYSSFLPASSASRRIDVAALVCLLLYLASASSSGSDDARAAWFPDKPVHVTYSWRYAPCAGCAPIEAKRDWLRMQHLAGLEHVHFLLAPDGRLGDAYSFAPNAVVLSPTALRLPRCQLDFVIGHELVHLAMHDFDEDAKTAAVLSGFSPLWTTNGSRALSLLDGDFGLALKMSAIRQGQERRADWVGALLAAQGAGCTVDEGAVPYLAAQAGYGGGLGAAHDPSGERVQFIEGFAAPAARLAARW